LSGQTSCLFCSPGLSVTKGGTACEGRQHASTLEVSYTHSVADITPPVITGPTAAVVINQGDPTFSYPVVTAVDRIDGAVNVQRTGNVDISKYLTKYKGLPNSTSYRC
jgi:hypothetical protein